MKTFIICVGLLLSPSVFANLIDWNLPGAGMLIKSMCGKNSIEAPSYPGEVCIYGVAGSERQVVGIDFITHIDFYLVTETTDAKITAVPAVVSENQGTYTLVDKTDEAAVEFAKSGYSLNGPMFDVVLDFVIFEQ